ncbi:hypothetical protein EYF80_008669 [Liparis tanakae]|uniref:Uncharacterized protein n=1 Tax=Liparis tanakae TaxID=230148 RepID=A0A4Z2IUW4_9TELE|nr:hypothetical protein EYF80_008669 [Liparis tanakae]
MEPPLRKRYSSAVPKSRSAGDGNKNKKGLQDGVGLQELFLQLALRDKRDISCRIASAASDDAASAQQQQQQQQQQQPSATLMGGGNMS